MNEKTNFDEFIWSLQEFFNDNFRKLFDTVIDEKFKEKAEDWRLRNTKAELF